MIHHIALLVVVFVNLVIRAVLVFFVVQYYLENFLNFQFLI